MKNFTKNELTTIYEGAQRKYAEYKAMGLKLDMSRGKPCREQLDLSMGLLDEINSETALIRSTDYRNYGGLDGIPEAKELFASLCEVDTKEIIVQENASLILMYDSLQRAMQFGVLGGVPFNKQKAVKWLCPVPGYDRHFAVTELFGIEMINIPRTETGPDMDMREALVESDETVKGIWCVPKYSNPQGIVYSDETVKRFARLKPKADDFRIYWDNAYMVHTLYETDVPLLNLYNEAKSIGNEDIVYMFGSTSKISFAGAGVAFMVASEKNLASLLKLMGIQSIGPNKINQYAHVKFFKNKEGILKQIQKHAAILRPKFEMVDRIMKEEISEFATWHTPLGGYFISCDLLNGTAKETVRLAKEAGVVFTPAGSTYPKKLDPNDANLRIAPSLPPVADLETAMRVFSECVKITACKKLLGIK